VGGLGAAAATPAFLADLARLLRDEEAGVRAAAAGAVGGLGAAAATPAFLADLALLLRDQERYVRAAAAKTLGAILRRGLRLFLFRRWFRRPAWLIRPVTELAALSVPSSASH
jgi:hypothetical protein